jgi:N-methylhydantoinase B
MSQNAKVHSRSSGILSEIIRSHLFSAAEEMRRTLIRTAFNPVIYDVLDFGISIYNSDLDLVAEAPGIPSFIGANDYAIKKAVEFVGAENLEQGDILIMNYPYWSSAHTSDATLFAPVFAGNTKLAAFQVIRAHWIDLGAKDPGYVLDSNSMHQEGVVFPGTKVYTRGQPNKDVIDILRFNSRVPDILLGDMNAQIASMRTGEKRLHQIYDKFGLSVVNDAVEHLLKHGEEESLQALAKLPRGSWSATDYIDDDGISDDLIKLKATVSISEKTFTVDFTGSDPAVKGPVNLPIGATHSVCRIAFKSLTTPYLPSNGGNYRPLQVIAPPGTVMHAVYPSATYTLWTSHVAFELIFKALAAPMQDSISASSGCDLPGFQMIGVKPQTGRFYALSNNEPIGWGAASTHDGSNALQNHTANIARNTPIEVLEIRTGMMIEKMELIKDSGGPGKFRGGVGVQRDIRIVEDGEFLSVMKKTKTKPWALAGGWEPDPSIMILFPGTEREKRVGTYRTKVKVGDLLRLLTAGGGGYGNPKERAPHLVLEDILDELVSLEAARSIYAVATEGSDIDERETQKLRGI